MIPSNAFWMSSLVTISCRIFRALTSESSLIAPEADSTRSMSKRQAGLKRWTVLLPIQVAKASFSQVSSHHAIVTRSPNHWCASSCDMKST